MLHSIRMDIWIASGGRQRTEEDWEPSNWLSFACDWCRLSLESTNNSDCIHSEPTTGWENRHFHLQPIEPECIQLWLHQESLAEDGGSIYIWQPEDYKCENKPGQHVGGNF